MKHRSILQEKAFSTLRLRYLFLQVLLLINLDHIYNSVCMKHKIKNLKPEKIIPKE